MAVRRPYSELLRLSRQSVWSGVCGGSKVGIVCEADDAHQLPNLSRSYEIRYSIT